MNEQKDDGTNGAAVAGLVVGLIIAFVLYLCGAFN